MDKGNTPLNIFIDLSKAFDTIDHSILLYKLQYYGLKENAYKLMKNYLNDRKQYVEIEKYQSDELSITTGVPQGSIFRSPLIYHLH